VVIKFIKTHDDSLTNKNLQRRFGRNQSRVQETRLSCDAHSVLLFVCNFEIENDR